MIGASISHFSHTKREISFRSTPAKSAPENPNDVFLRVQLPNDSTTVIIVNHEMMMWEIMNVICAKKQLIPSQHTMKAVFTDGKEEIIQGEKALTDYTNLERVVVMKNARTFDS
jgi:hypothetical protein